jgi:hypothetical protein
MSTILQMMLLFSINVKIIYLPHVNKVRVYVHFTSCKRSKDLCTLKFNSVHTEGCF